MLHKEARVALVSVARIGPLRAGCVRRAVRGRYINSIRTQAAGTVGMTALRVPLMGAANGATQGTTQGAIS